MKLLLQLGFVFGMFFMVGCSSNANQLQPMQRCNNPKCQCPKPCQCGPSCQCGMNGNSTTMAEDAK